MKGLVVTTLALCLGACASQPGKVVTADQPSCNSTDQTRPSKVVKAGPSHRVYLDDYQLIPVQAPPQRRGMRVLGTKNG